MSLSHVLFCSAQVAYFFPQVTMKYGTGSQLIALGPMTTKEKKQYPYCGLDALDTAQYTRYRRYLKRSAPHIGQPARALHDRERPSQQSTTAHANVRR
jgi:hypothetical protein